MRVMRHLPDTRLLASRHGLIESVPVLLKRLAPGKTPFVVCDEHTWDAAGSRLQEILAAAGAPRPAQPLKLTSPEDDYKFAEKVAVSISAAGTNPEDVIPLAVGSGTITDVVRLGSFLAGIRFISIPTAPSMDGYASAGSPVMKDGFKKTIQCRGPLAVLTDLDIAAGAPRHLAAAGTGDLLGKITAGADWLTAHRLGLEPVDRGVFTFVQKPVRGLIKYLLRDRGQRLQEGGIPPETDLPLSLLMRGLTRSSLAMQATADSRCASGSEHRISHVLDMIPVLKGKVPAELRYHGFQVGLGTVLVTAFAEALIEIDLSSPAEFRTAAPYPAWEDAEKNIRRLFEDPVLAEEAASETRLKYLTPEEIPARREKISASWPRIRTDIVRQLFSFSDIREALSRAGCPAHPRDMGLSREDTVRLLESSLLIRSRYTLLDLAFEAGVFGKCSEKALSKFYS